MNKNLLFKITAALLLAGLITGCSGKDTQEQTQAETGSDAGSAILEETIGDACNNIFYPLKKDNQWVYQLDTYLDDYAGQEVESASSDIALTVSEVNESTAKLGALDYDTGVVTESIVQCQDQTIINFPLTELNMVFGDLAGNLDVSYVNGKFMPSAQEFADNSWSLEWETEYKASGSLEANYDGEALSAVLSDSPVKMRWQVTGTGESMEVAAGLFNDLVKINREISIDITSLKTFIEGEQVDIATTLTLSTDMYYAPNVGLIKQEINSASINLFGFNFPIDAWGYIELKSYTVN
jgi:hypothetical protein